MNEHASVKQDKDAAGHRARLRKRLLEAGAEAFHDYELVEYLPRSRSRASIRNRSRNN